MLLLTILTFAFVSAEAVFLTTANHEDANLRYSYNDVSNQIISTFFDRIRTMMTLSQSMATEITESTVQQEWPFVTLSNFEERCKGPLQLGYGSMISFSPKVPLTELVQWQEYAVKNQSLLGTNNIVLDDDANVTYYYSNRTMDMGVYYFQNGTSSSVIFYNFEEEYVVPIWQMSPLPPPPPQLSPNNENVVDDVDDVGVVGTLFDEISNNVRAKALRTFMTKTSKNATATATTTTTTVGTVTSSFLYQDTDSTDLAVYGTPWTSMYTPIYSSLSSSSSSSSSSSDKNDKDVVGTINYQFTWEDAIFNNVLDESYSNGKLVVVVQNLCTNLNFSYTIAGPNASYTGIGDLHDTKVKVYTSIRNTTYEQYDSLFVVVPTTTTNSDSTSSKISTNDNASSCPYKITVYPTSSFQGMYKSNRPLVYRGIVLVALFFLIITFGIFDSIVQKHSKTFVDAARDSDEIVRSLFPKDVADRMYKQKRQQRRNNKENSSFVTTRKNRISKLLKLSDDDDDDYGHGGDGSDHFADNNIHNTKTLSNRNPNNNEEPLADVYPSATVIFADMAGFTSWSSERDPSQVFTLLEKIYSSMDRTAKKCGVFKVETIGDCYVAATGVPEPCPNHAVLMCTFARSCLIRTNALFRKLVSDFGPGTDCLLFRFGINSGPVTAGVLRGQKARFQLFGDTINIASRMESNGIKGRIQISESTAELLIASNKENWFVPREEMIDVKGKGLMQTYWLKTTSTGYGGVSSSGRSSSSNRSDVSSSNDYNSAGWDHPVVQHYPHGSDPNNNHDLIDHDDIDDPTITTNVLHGVLGQTRINSNLSCLIEWNTEVFLDRLKAIKIRNSVLYGSNSNNAAAAAVSGKKNTTVQAKQASSVDVPSSSPSPPAATTSTLSYEMEYNILCGSTIIPRNEVKMSIPIVSFDSVIEQKIWQRTNSSNSIRLKPMIEKETKEFIKAVATSYPKNAFHNFEHASHVVLAATKLLKRIMSADEHVSTNEGKLTNVDLYNHTFGIAYDPLVQFAIIFSCLCHDLNHKGVPNVTLQNEVPNLSKKYEHHSIAEQHSIDIAFHILMLPQFTNLRRAIYITEDECRRFKQLCINLIMATDLMDKDLIQMRNERWKLCFNATSSTNNSTNAASEANENNTTTTVGTATDADAADVVAGDGAAKDDEEEEAQIRNHKATLVMELVIQASDVAHTYQHWAVYTKWNECLFQEMYMAYIDGRTTIDPTINWYSGEIGFFQYHIIPFAKKMKDCWSVFGICHSEFLNYATSNLREWEMKGKDVVEQYKANVMSVTEKRNTNNNNNTNNSKELGTGSNSRNATGTKMQGVVTELLEKTYSPSSNKLLQGQVSSLSSTKITSFVQGGAQPLERRNSSHHSSSYHTNNGLDDFQPAYSKKAFFSKNK